MMKKLTKFITKISLCTILFLILAILSKTNIEYHDKIHYYLYEYSFNFNSIYNFYNKYLGGLSFFEKNQKKTNQVFSEEIKYKSFKKYQNGLKLEVSNNYLIPNLKEGIIIYIGKKDLYNNTIIIKTNNNINIWYGNICNYPNKLYDRIDKGIYIGEACNNYFYLVYEKDGLFLDPNKYFSS